MTVLAAAECKLLRRREIATSGKGEEDVIPVLRFASPQLLHQLMRKNHFSTLLLLPL